MTWHVKVDDDWRNTDDLTLDEITAIEQVVGEPWSLLNPFRSAPTAKAMYAAFLIRDGVTDEAAAAQVGAFSMRWIKDRFRFRKDDDLPDTWEDGLPVVDPKPDPVAPSTG
jgi:hypothetical protein